MTLKWWPTLWLLLAAEEIHIDKSDNIILNVDPLRSFVLFCRCKDIIKQENIKGYKINWIVRVFIHLSICVAVMH